MLIGLDFGTTNTVAAYFAGSRMQFVPLQPEGYNRIVMPSVLFIARSGQILLGQEAIDQYMVANQGRDIIYEQRFLGQIEMLFAGTEGTQGRDVELVQDVYARIDVNQPGRLFQSLKLALADEGFAATNIYGTRWTLEELIALFLREVRARVEQATGEAVTGIMLGRPVHYGTTPDQDSWAVERMQRACDLAGLPAVRFLLEPVAAAYAYAAQVQQRCQVLVFDFGGGTLDLTVMQLDPAGAHAVLAVAGAVVGGDMLNSRIVKRGLARYFGEGATLGPDRLPLPAFLLESLGDWQQLMELSTPRALQILQQAINTSDRPAELRALRSLVRENYGLQLYREVERAKCRLSEELQTRIAMDVGDIHFAHGLTRQEFEMFIALEVRQVTRCVDQVLQEAGLQAQQIDTVLLTGGSSRIPRFVRLLAERFGAERLRTQDAYTSIVAGLAIAAQNG